MSIFDHTQQSGPVGVHTQAQTGFLHIIPADAQQLMPADGAPHNHDPALRIPAGDGINLDHAVHSALP